MQSEREMCAFNIIEQSRTTTLVFFSRTLARSQIHFLMLSAGLKKEKEKKRKREQISRNVLLFLCTNRSRVNTRGNTVPAGG